MMRCRLILIPLLLFHVLFVLAADKDDKKAPESKGEKKEEKVDDVQAKSDKPAGSPKSKSNVKSKTEAANERKTKAKVPTTAKPSGEAKSEPKDNGTVPELMRGKVTTKASKVSPWEKIPNAPTFVGHLIVPYPTSNFISLTMKQAYVLYLWLQVRRLKDLFKEMSDGVKPDKKLDLNADDINAMISDFSKTGFLKLPLPYKPPLFLPTDPENIEGIGDDDDDDDDQPDQQSNDYEPSWDSEDLGKGAKPAAKAQPVTNKTLPPGGPAAIKTPPLTASASKKQPPLERPPPPIIGSQSFPPPSNSKFPTFPASRSKLFANANSKFPLKVNPAVGLVSFPSKTKPRAHAVYPTPEKVKPPAPKPKPPRRNEFQKQLSRKAKPKPSPPPRRNEFQKRKAKPLKPIRDKRRFLQRVSNYMNQIGRNRQAFPEN